MKVLFSGPTLAGTDADMLQGLVLRPPAQHGDVWTAVRDGATAIGLVDGLYEDVLAVWHKEILFALARGVHVFGAASMGALRAAECAAFGMVGIGEIYLRYADGRLEDDAAVAQLHAPAELGFAPLTEALVNVEATLSALVADGRVDEAEFASLVTSARGLFFKDRTHARIVRSADVARDRAAALVRLLDRHRVDLKRADALLLVRELLKISNKRDTTPKPWIFNESQVWRDIFYKSN